MVTRDLEPILLPNDRAISMGLILTELGINANNYAYGGEPGPLHISLTQLNNSFRLTLVDHGKGRDSARIGFGSGMIEALVRQLGGTLEFASTRPGTTAILSAPIDIGSAMPHGPS